MNPPVIALIVFACVFGSALLGQYLRTVLPEHHLSADAKDVVKLATGLIATISALVLSLLISSAKGSFDRVNSEIVQGAAAVLQLDRALAEYGPETAELRGQIKQHFVGVVDAIDTRDNARLRGLESSEAMIRLERMQAAIRALPARSEFQRGQQARALHMMNELFSARWHVMLNLGGSISMPLLIVLVSWLVIIFTAFGLFAPRNPTVNAALLLCALAAACAILLILEMDRPLGGLITISTAPLHDALAHLGR